MPAAIMAILRMLGSMALFEGGRRGLGAILGSSAAKAAGGAAKTALSKAPTLLRAGTAARGAYGALPKGIQGTLAAAPPFIAGGAAVEAGYPLIDRLLGGSQPYAPPTQAMLAPQPTGQSTSDLLLALEKALSSGEMDAASPDLQSLLELFSASPTERLI